MSKTDRRFPTGQTALRAWLLIVGVFVGALVAMSASWAFSWGVLAPTPEEQQAAAKEARQKAFTSPPGSCLTWTEPDASDVRKVPCTQQHLFEVVGVADISDKYGPKAKTPDAETWRSLTETQCGEIARKYLGKPLDPYGKLSLGVLRPDPKQWAKGQRKLHCGLQWLGPGGGPQELIGLAADVNQSDVWPPGTCLALQNKTVGDPVPCAKKHAAEIIGLIDLKTRFDSYVSEEDQYAWLDRKCNGLATQYASGSKWKEQGLQLTWDTRKKVSWDAGSTQVNCWVGAKLKDNSGLAPVTGSIADSAPKPKAPQDGKQGQPGEQGEQGQNGDNGGSPNPDNGGSAVPGRPEHVSDGG